MSEIWDIENNNNLVFSYGTTDNDLTPKITFSNRGNIKAASFIGDGSKLTNLPKVWEQDGNNIIYNKGNVQIGIHPSGYYSFNSKLNVVAEGDVDAGMWDGQNSHPFAIIGEEDLMFMGTDKEYRCAYIQGFHFKDTTNKGQGAINLILNKFGGNVGIGTTNPQYKLDVRGEAHFCKVRIKSDGWCDNVFEDDYQLLALDSLELYIKTNKHLPDIPTEQNVLENDVDLGEMNKLLLKKVEELTLYIIELQKQINEQSAEIQKLKTK